MKAAQDADCRTVTLCSQRSEAVASLKSRICNKLLTMPSSLSPPTSPGRQVPPGSLRKQVAGFAPWSHTALTARAHMYSKQRGDSQAEGLFLCLWLQVVLRGKRHLVTAEWQRGRRFYLGFTGASLTLPEEKPGFSGLNGDLKVPVICFPLWLLGQCLYFLTSENFQYPAM